MTIKNSLSRFLLIFVVLAAASIACSLPGKVQAPPAQNPSNDTNNIQPGQLQATQNAAKAAGQTVVTVTQQQLTAYMQQELSQQNEQVFTDPQVVLTNGQMEVYGKVNQSGISADSKIVLKPQVGADGNPKLNIVSMEVGPIPVPDSFKSQAQGMVDNVLTNYLASNNNRFKVKDITISEGEMTVIGVPQ